MKKREIALSFFAGLILLLFLTNVFYGRYRSLLIGVVDERDFNLYGMERQTENTIDILLLGNSLANTGLAAPDIYQITGMTIYSATQPLQRTWEAYSVLKRFLKRQSPKLVIIETDMIYRDSGEVADINDRIFEAAAYAFPVLEYHDRWKGKFGFGEDVFRDRLNDMGYYFSENIHPYMSSAGSSYTKLQDGRHPKQIDFYYTGKIIKLCRRKGIDVVMTSVVCPKLFNGTRHEDYQAFADKNGVPYVDLNAVTDEIDFDWENSFKDEYCEHLNGYGAAQITEYLGRYLEEQYFADMESSLSAEEEEKWQAAYADYEGRKTALENKILLRQP